MCERNHHGGLEMKGSSRTEETLVLIKPDAYIRGLTGKILNRFLETGLALVASKVVLAPSRKLVDRHLPNEDVWITKLGEIVLRRCDLTEHDPIVHFGSHDPAHIGRIIREWIINFMASGPIVVFVLSGDDAIKRVRSLVGNTTPKLAENGTIRADHFANSPDFMDIIGVGGQNGVHASDSQRSFEREVKLWIPEYFGTKSRHKRKEVKKHAFHGGIDRNRQSAVGS